MTLLPTLGAALVLAFARSGTLAARLLTQRIFVGIGLVSYSAYLWHQPLLVFARYAQPSGLTPLIAMLAISASFMLAWLSWRYVELYFRRQHRASTKQVLTVAIAASLSIVVIGLVINKNHGFETYFFANRLNQEQKKIYSIIAEQTRDNPAKMLLDDDHCRFRVEQLTSDFVNRFSECRKFYDKAVIVAGDSHAINIFNALFREGREPFLVGIARAGCRPYEVNPECPDSALPLFLAQSGEGVRYLIFHQSGSHLMKDPAGRQDNDELFAKPGNYSLLLNDIEAVKTYLDQLSTHVPTYWFGPFAEARVNFANFNQFSNGFRMNPHALSAFRHLDEILKKSDKQMHHGSWQYLSLLEILAMNDDYLMIDQCLTFRDTDHFSVCGERIAGARISKYLQRLKNSVPERQPSL